MDEFTNNFGEFDVDSLLINQGQTALESGHIEAASSYFIKTIRDSSNDNNVEFCHSQLAECHYRRERWRDCMESAKISQNNANSKALFALSSFHRNDPHTAFETIKDFENWNELNEYVKKELETYLPEIKQSIEKIAPKLPVHISEKAMELKVQGNHKFKLKDFAAASKLYRNGINALDSWLVDAQVADEEVMDQFRKAYGVLLSNLLNSEMNQGNLHQCKDLCNKLVEVQGNWKKSHYWSGMCYLACSLFSEAEKHFNRCLSCSGVEKDNINDKINFVKFSESHETLFKTVSMVTWQVIYEAHCKNVCWLAGNHFAMSITKMYSDTDSQYHMTTSALIDNYGKITNFLAPKYEASERDRNLINEMKRNEKKKLYIHLMQLKMDGSQQIVFSNTENLSEIAKLSLTILEKEINSKNMFNAFIKNYLK